MATQRAQATLEDAGSTQRGLLRCGAPCYLLSELDRDSLPLAWEYARRPDRLQCALGVGWEYDQLHAGDGVRGEVLRGLVVADAGDDGSRLQRAAQHLGLLREEAGREDDGGIVFSHDATGA